MDFTTIITPEIVTKIAENGVLVFAIFLLFIFVYFMYAKFTKHRENLKIKDVEKDLEIEKIKIKQKEKQELENHKREDKHRDMTEQVTLALKESVHTTRNLREDVQEKDQLIKDIVIKNTQHRFKIVKHVTNAENETQVILQCPNCKKNGEVVLNELGEIKQTAQRSITNE